MRAVPVRPQFLVNKFRFASSNTVQSWHLNDRSLYATIKEVLLEPIPREIIYYVTEDGKVPFRNWYDSLDDIDIKVAIKSRLTRVERGLLGDCKAVGRGVLELRVFMGPGYRIYIGLLGKEHALLLQAGTKKTKNKDIKTAQHFLQDY